MSRLGSEGKFAFVLACLMLSGCSGKQGSATPVAPSSESMAKTIPANVQGEWVVVADTSGQGDTGHLFLNADGTFKANYKSGGTDDKYSGTYTIAEEKLAGQTSTVVSLQILTDNGKTAPSSPPLELRYDPVNYILSDSMTVAYSRPGNVAAGQKLFTRDTISGGTVAAKEITGRKLWEVQLSGVDKGFSSGVTSGELSPGAEAQVVVADESGFKVVDAAGRLVHKASLDSGRGFQLVLGELEGKALIVPFDVWGHEIRAFDPSGNLLWSCPAGSTGIDWVSSVQIDPRNTAYAIAYNGGGGLELVGPNGKSRWTHPADWNMWGVTGTKSGLIICVGPSENAIAFDAAGKKVKEYQTGEIGSVGSEDIDGDGKEEVLTLGTTISSGLNLTVIDNAGKIKWSHKAAPTDHAFLSQPFLSGEFGTAGHLVGVGDAGGILFFKPDGTIFGTFKSKEMISSATILHRKGKADLVVLRLPDRLRCYELQVGR